MQFDSRVRSIGCGDALDYSTVPKRRKYGEGRATVEWWRGGGRWYWATRCCVAKNDPLYKELSHGRTCSAYTISHCFIIVQQLALVGVLDWMRSDKKSRRNRRKCHAGLWMIRGRGSIGALQLKSQRRDLLRASQDGKFINKAPHKRRQAAYQMLWHALYARSVYMI